jgi:truncated hemoglobin YjbI
VHRVHYLRRNTRGGYKKPRFRLCFPSIFVLFDSKALGSDNQIALLSLSLLWLPFFERMSKFELQRLSQSQSGVSYEESIEAANLSPSIYERIGQDGFYKLSELFYNRVFNDKETQWFLNIFSGSTRAEAIENQYRFFVQTFGGPDLYKQKKGKYTRLVGRHANYNIGTRAADRWVQHMNEALKEHDKLGQDEEARAALYKYFLFTAHYIVVASEYMRPDQVSQQLASGRNKNLMVSYLRN